MASRLLHPVLVFFLLSQMASTSSCEKVTLSLYYETLCPYCADFIVNRLVEVFDKQLISILNLRLIPWGNAFLQSDGSFSCQHGPDECFLNTIEACAITIYPDVERHFRFVQCVERMSLQNKANEWVNCSEISGLGKGPIDCYNSGYGNMLEQQFAAETAQLNPPHRFVPWVVVNNQPLQEDFVNFVSYVCRAYTGSEVPEACKSVAAESNKLWKENAITSVCSAHKAANFTSSSAPSFKAFMINP